MCRDLRSRNGSIFIVVLEEYICGCSHFGAYISFVGILFGLTFKAERHQQQLILSDFEDKPICVCVCVNWFPEGLPVYLPSRRSSPMF